MLKQQMRLKFEINGREYFIFCDNDSPTTDMKEMACQVINIMSQIEENAKAKTKSEYEASQNDQSKVEPIPEEKQA